MRGDETAAMGQILGPTDPRIENQERVTDPRFDKNPFAVVRKSEVATLSAMNMFRIIWSQFFRNKLYQCAEVSHLHRDVGRCGFVEQVLKVLRHRRR